ncbi:TPA: hypothetical protein N0F65_009762 [Lagenidium giganteum]|uniref:Multifunctional methyltransferase subunit TRM112-like protein n=1 Tax=Lagenidium giganteum TaxID=4803 RepID=A0AAV2YLW1_9STRA|nr:TPA: hypothetical protein N0F65_009762 [Lagenidium giganteum]
MNTQSSKKHAESPVVSPLTQSQPRVHVSSYRHCVSEEGCLLPSTFKERKDPSYYERVYPWMQWGRRGECDNGTFVDKSIAMNPTDVSTTMATKSKSTKTVGVITTINGDVHMVAETQSVTTRLLTSRSTSELQSMEHHGLKSYGTSKPRRHSILRLDSTGVAHSSERGMKKSPSVEFVLDIEEEIKRIAKARRLSDSSSGKDQPRRLTDEEKEELYRQRPDLEIGPSSYLEHLKQLEKQNNRRLIFAMVGTTPPSTMRLITHNVLMCNKKGVQNGFPLRIEADEVQVVESEFQAEFIKKMLTKIDWSAFIAGAQALNVADGLPTEYSQALADDEAFLKKVHHALLDVHVKNGKLICPETGREFPVVDGIPNMLLREDEV